MKAIVVQKEVPDRPLVWQEVPSPIYEIDEVLVDIHATALNRADLMQRAGNYPPPVGAPDIMGLEMAGRIAAVGASSWITTSARTARATSSSGGRAAASPTR